MAARTPKPRAEPVASQQWRTQLRMSESCFPSPAGFREHSASCANGVIGLNQMAPVAKPRHRAVWPTFYQEAPFRHIICRHDI
ncbi:hypothetical protein ZHAS_00019798 [Anopheles sinensis]|uniref:Uncharacterized protein n=1 Tax=Anopheles sinensis TaxID=74873 RepID=A0A084WME5_ANOSI|nr:hypothetical protein ZHAS_00019798 [Anopheles sinensis]